MANSGHTFFRNIFALLNKALHIAGSSVAATHTVRAYDNRKNSGIALSRSVAAAHGCRICAIIVSACVYAFVI